MPYVLIDDAKLKEFDPDGSLKTLPDDTGDKLSRLEEHANKLLNEKKTLQLSFDEYKVESKKKLSEFHSSSGAADTEAIQSKLDDALSRVKDWEGKYDGLVQEGRAKTLESKALELASSMTTDKTRAKLLTDIFKSRLNIDGDSVGVLDESGKQTISSIDELSSQVRALYPFLVDGSKASRGDAFGGAGGAGNAYKKFNEYSGSELAAIRKDKPEIYDRLKSEHYNTN